MTAVQKSPSRSPEQVADRRARMNVLRLALATALGGGNAAVVHATGAILGAILAPDPAYATAPISVYVVGMAASTLPAGAIARRRGRRAAFLLGSGFGVVGGLLACLASLYGSFALFCFACLLCGFYGSIVQTYRFSAADSASESYRPKAISLVMAGGVAAAFVGPQTVRWTMDLWAPYLFAASYLAQAVIALLAMFVLSTFDGPKPRKEDLHAGRPLAEIARQPRFIVAAVCGVVSYAMMNVVMTSAPLAMRMCGLSLVDSTIGLQWHIVAMYLPSFFTGSLIQRFGVRKVVSVGMALIAASAVSGLSGLDVWHFWIGLVLLGVGWNFGFVGASAMVVACHRPEERNKVQALNDFIVFGVMAVGSFLSGHILAHFGWSAVNLIVFPAVALALGMLAVSAIAQKRRAIQAA